MGEIFELEQVSYQYTKENAPAVKEISVSFEEGKMYAVIGKSGSGKSTLLSMLSGMRVATAGQILYRGKDLAKMDRDAYRRTEISLIHQAYHLFPRLTVMENVCYPLELSGMSLKEAQVLAGEKLTSVGLKENQWNSYPANLSGGEQQRVAIARALAKGGNVFLADEPTGNLDSENTELIMKLLRKLVVEEGYCVIIVTHDNTVAAQTDVTLRMENGILVFS